MPFPLDAPPPIPQAEAWLERCSELDERLESAGEGSDPAAESALLAQARALGPALGALFAFELAPDASFEGDALSRATLTARSGAFMPFAAAEALLELLAPLGWTPDGLMDGFDCPLVALASMPLEAAWESLRSLGCAWDREGQLASDPEALPRLDALAEREALRAAAPASPGARSGPRL